MTDPTNPLAGIDAVMAEIRRTQEAADRALAPVRELQEEIRRTIAPILAMAEQASRAAAAVGFGMPATKRLWEIDHPYYGADGYTTHCESFADLRHSVDRIDEDMNHVYRWDWEDDSQPHREDLFLEGEPRDKQKFRVFMVLPRKSTFIEFVCPVTHDDEPAVLEWLRSDRVLGAMRRMWEPVLGDPTGGA
ncbi:hypothetical protein AB0M54_24485 [Actinoplanes sp. NPDC051470]|uniref:hypothetical protein n=1 Tax=Actinoplanes sp. NPDC051470 TaxID=3157224 RepID=UPI0034147351